MKKVLILAYDFPPYVSVGGLRPYSWYKYFNEFGVYPIVVTRQWGNKHGSYLDYVEAGYSNKTIVEETEFGKIIRTPYKPNFANKLLLKYSNNKFILLRKLISAYYEFFQWFFIIGPKSKLYFASKNYLANNKVDVIIATGDPFVLFKYAALLSQKFNIPWVADYRDPWSLSAKRGSTYFSVIFKKYFEQKHSSTAALCTTVSSFVKGKIIAIVKSLNVEVVPNGFDPEVIEKATMNCKCNDVLRIGFVGTIYQWHPIKSFLKVFDEFTSCFPDVKIQINFYGINITNELQELLLNEYINIKNRVNIYPKLPNNELLTKLAKDNVMLLFNYYSYMGTKIYDYIGLKRKILFCYSDDNEANMLKKKYYNIKEIAGCSNHLQEDLIKETNSGIIVKDANHLKTVLEELYNEFIKKGYIECNSIGVEKYSRKIQCEKLAKIIKSLK